MYENQSTIHRANDIFNSGIGIAATLGMDWYADKVTDDLLNTVRKGPDGKNNKQLKDDFKTRSAQKA